jgi:hypothetical protein
MEKMVIKLTLTQHLRLKAVLDRACDESPSNLLLQELWHACARAETVVEPEVAVTPA